MTLTELRYIVALAQDGNFSRAAERCSVSQPTLSVAIARLEDELGVQLFERGKGFVSPSAVGIRVVEQAQRALEEAEQVRQIVMWGRNQLQGPLRLGVIHTIGPYLLPLLIQSLRRLAPEMPLAIEENMTASLAEMLRDNEVDVVILALPFEMAGIVTRAVYDEAFKVIVPRGHPWACKEVILPEEVAGDEVLLLKAGNCFRDQVLWACPQVSSPETGIRLGHSIGTIRCMVASGLGVSVLPDSALQHPYSNDLISVIPFCAACSFAPGRARLAGGIRPAAGHRRLARGIRPARLVGLSPSGLSGDQYLGLGLLNAFVEFGRAGAEFLAQNIDIVGISSLVLVDQLSADGVDTSMGRGNFPECFDVRVALTVGAAVPACKTTGHRIQWRREGASGSVVQIGMERTGPAAVIDFGDQHGEVFA